MEAGRGRCNLAVSDSVKSPRRRVSMRMADRLERDIDSMCSLTVRGPTAEVRREAFHAMAMLHRQRSAETVARMEREQGLR
jgi:hypothetical protein